MKRYRVDVGIPLDDFVDVVTDGSPTWFSPIFKAREDAEAWVDKYAEGWTVEERTRLRSKIDESDTDGTMADGDNAPPPVETKTADQLTPVTVASWSIPATHPSGVNAAGKVYQPGPLASGDMRPGHHYDHGLLGQYGGNSKP